MTSLATNDIIDQRRRLRSTLAWAIEEIVRLVRHGSDCPVCGAMDNEGPAGHDSSCLVSKGRALLAEVPE